MYCIHCGTNIKKEDNYCTACGSKIEPNYNNYTPASNNTQNSNGTASLVLGIIACVLCYTPVISIILGIISIVLGCSYKKQTGNKTAGTILGIVSLVLTFVYIIFMAFLFFVISLDYEDEYNDNYSESEKYDPMDNFTSDF